MIVILALLLGLISYWFYRSDSFTYHEHMVQYMAQSIAASIDGDRFASIAKTEIEDEYWAELKVAFDKAKTDTGVEYLYALDSGGDGTAKYVVEGSKPGDDPDDIGSLGDVEPAGTFAEEGFVAITSRQATASKPYVSGEYGMLITGAAPIFDSNDNVVGVICVDLSLSTVMSSINQFMLRITVVALFACVLFGFLLLLFVQRKIGAPINELCALSHRVASGEIDIDAKVTSQDEIGKLAVSFQEIVVNSRKQVELLDAIAEGDYTGSVNVRSEYDRINQAISQILDQYNHLILEIRTAATQVAGGADQIANGAQSLASGSSEQSASIGEFSAALREMSEKIESNTANAKESLSVTSRAGELMGESMQSMNEMLSAMQTIDESSRSITKVIKVIDDIAFQTNILALNAAVEAARAGMHGKGFAVVANEVRNLASKSAAAAKETADLIEGSSVQVDKGGTIVAHTNKSLSTVGETAQENLKVIQTIAESCDEQTRAIEELNASIEQIEAVVQANSATAEESAATAEEMSAQANILRQLFARFKLRNDNTSSSANLIPFPSSSALNENGFSLHEERASTQSIISMMK